AGCRSAAELCPARGTRGMPSARDSIHASDRTSACRSRPRSRPPLRNSADLLEPLAELNVVHQLYLHGNLEALEPLGAEAFDLSCERWTVHRRRRPDLDADDVPDERIGLSVHRGLHDVLHRLDDAFDLGR